MDKVINFFKNNWVKRFFALFTVAYPLFIAYVDWLAFAYLYSADLCFIPESRF